LHVFKLRHAHTWPREDRAIDGKRTKPMLTTAETSLSSAWPFLADPNAEILSWPGQDPSLIDAIASIVEIAAERARSSGTLDALRAAVDAALQAAVAPAVPSAEPPHASSGPR
jgi:hypothetical protein